MSTNRSRRMMVLALALGAAGAFVGLVSLPVRAKAQSKKDFAVSARKYSYTVQGSDKPEIRVQEGDLVRITFSAEDIPHSFTIVNDDHYRIMRRAEPGKPVTFDFVADKPGTFTFQCTLTADERCKELSGTLSVAARR